MRYEIRLYSMVLWPSSGYGEWRLYKSVVTRFWWRVRLAIAYQKIVDATPPTWPIGLLWKLRVRIHG